MKIAGTPLARFSRESGIEETEANLSDLRQPISRGFLHTATNGAAPGFFYEPGRGVKAKLVLV
jgi:hypothetical protein